LILPVIALASAFWSMLILFGVAALYVVSYLRTAKGLLSRQLTLREAASHACFITLSKFPNLTGMLIYYWRRRKGRPMTLIEYK
jgi:hypothetical protein